MKHRIALVFALFTLAACDLPGGPACAQTPSPLQLHLSVAQRAAVTDARGHTQLLWESLDAAGVRPGAVLRYTLAGHNGGARPVGGLALTQPVPAGMTFVPHTADAAGTRVTYSLDGGRTFDAKPMIRVTTPGGVTHMVPAPPASYTQVRWTLPGAVAPGGDVRVSCEVKVD